jgi:hypothetical protein
LLNIIEQNNILYKEKSKLTKEIKLLKENNEKLSEEILKSKKENDILQNRINILSEENFDINDKYNKINTKYFELKKVDSEKDKEIKNANDNYKDLIDKQRKKFEQENNIHPNEFIIKRIVEYKNLIWYLLFKKPHNKNKKNPDDKKEINENVEEKNYNNYKWVTGLLLKKGQEKKYVKKIDNDELKDMENLVVELQKKLEKKEEEKNKLDYQNKKLIEQIHGKTTSAKGLRNTNITNISKNTNLNEPYKNKSAIDEILQLKNEIKQLKRDIAAREKLEAELPKKVNYIEFKENDSLFFDDEIKDNKSGMMEFINSKNVEEGNSKKSGVPQGSINSKMSDYKISEKKVDEFLNKGNEEDDLDMEKLLQKQLNYLKKEVSETNNKYNMLEGQVKELLKHIKCDMKNKPQIVQICQILGFDQDKVNKIVSNKK